MEGENVTGYWFGISYTCTALPYKPVFIKRGRVFAFRPKGHGSILGRGMEIFLRVSDTGLFKILTSEILTKH